MNLLGDLERIFATSLYPLRVPIAIAVVLGLVALAIVARRRGWASTARRHPRRTGVVAATALIVGLPIAWYLGSPLFIRTELLEPAPVALADAESPPPTPAPASTNPVAPESRGAEESGAPSTAAPKPSPTPFVAAVVTSGTFHGADDFHFGEGTASIIEVEPGSYTLRFEDFSVRNGPDLYVYLSPDPDGYADGVLELGTLKATDGAFGYDLPSGTDPSRFASAVIWCKQFAVQFAVAEFEAG